jgi:hypothetical protein
MEKLFNTVINYGYYVRKSEKNGLEAWNEIKKIMSENDYMRIKIDAVLNNWDIEIYIEGKQTKEPGLLYNYLKYELGLHGEEDDMEKMEKKTWERNHFYLQLGRIPKNNRCNMIRLLQIAYNIGQLVCEMKGKRYNEKQMNFFFMNRLYKMETYNKINKIKKGEAIYDPDGNEVIDIIEISNITNLDIQQLNYISSIKMEIIEMTKKYTKENINEYTDDISNTLTEE